jgi:N utilization substance protein B
MSARTKARKRALDVLYVADVRQIPIADSLASEAARATHEPDRAVSWAYARRVVTGVMEHMSEIDELIQTYSQNWALERMPIVDRATLRIAIWELLFNDEIPDGVAISEAVDLARSLSTDDSAGFINGMLASIAKTKS